MHPRPTTRRTQLVIAGTAVLAVLLLAIAGSRVVSEAQDAMGEEIKDNERVMAMERAEGLAQAVALAGQRVKVNSNYDVVRIAIEEGYYEDMEAALGQAAASPGVVGGAVALASGEVVARQGRGVDLGTRDQPRFAAGERTATVTISASIARADGSDLARLYQSFDVRGLAPQFTRPVPYPGGTTTLATRDGDVVMSTTPDAPPRIPEGELLDLVRDGRTGTATHHAEALGGTRLTAIAPVRGTDLVAIVGADLRAASEPATTLVWRLSAILVATVVGLALLGAVVVAASRSSRRRLVAERQHADDLANRDPLTGLGNRRAFDVAVDELAAGSGTTAVVLADLDHLKDLNDRLGHEAGDRSIRAVGRALQSTVRPGDRTYRIGGDEFAVLLPDTDLARAEEVAERIEIEVAAIEVDGVGSISVSTGAHASDSGAIDDTVRQADRNLYEAKRRNRAVPVQERLRFVIERHGLGRGAGD